MKLRNLLLLFPIMACQPTVSDRFALEHMAQKYHDEHGLLRHSYDMRPSAIYSTCYGVLDKGLVVRFTCSLSNTECKSCDP